ncbi:MAG: phage shock protein A [Candidatus Methanogaster sp.]|uniref:Phage shock protein A n=1 Tax=Candidatus Methanogaster sp. TaxID=3386292 RepID=A0AC61L4V7_9EURY|nr:MAG: phage shock protein A [ANME-2 cluster archaeon]
MGLFKRMELVVKSKTNKLLDRYEDPRETLDYSYQKQLELLQQVKRSTATVITAKKRLELQRVKLQQNIQKLDSQAKDSVNAGRDDLARLVLERKANNVIEIESLTVQIQDQEIEQQKLIKTEKKLSAKINAFRTKKETIKAQYTAAEAQVKVKEAVTGISEEMADVGFAIDRAEEKTENMRAKSTALDEMVELGALDEIGGDDEIERELRKMKTTTGVDDELEKLKAEMKK